MDDKLTNNKREREEKEPEQKTSKRARYEETIAVKNLSNIIER